MSARTWEASGGRIVDLGTSGRVAYETGVVGQPSPADGLGDSPVKHDVGTPHSGRTEAAVPQCGIELVAISRGQLPQRGVADGREQLVVDDALPVGAGRGCQRGRCHELAEQDGDGRRRPAMQVTTGVDDEALQCSERLGPGPTKGS